MLLQACVFAKAPGALLSWMAVIYGARVSIRCNRLPMMHHAMDLGQPARIKRDSVLLVYLGTEIS